MAAEDYINFDWEEDTEDDVRCKYYGERDLFWDQTDDGRWILVGGEGNPHQCRKAPQRSAVIDDFQPE